MPNCAIPSCQNRGEKGKRMFQLPRAIEKACVWITFMVENKVKNFTHNLRLCEDHFIFDNDGKRSSDPVISFIDSQVMLIFLL